MKTLLSKITSVLILISITLSPLGIVSAQTLAIPVSDEGAVAKKECGPSVFGICSGLSMDRIGVAAAKMLLRNMTESIVDWINRGFEGGPSFLTNPEGFFVDMADQTIGAFIENNPDLNFLCSPISIDLRLALAFKYSPFKRRISCTLSQVISNVQNIPDNIYINGQNVQNSLLNGDFMNRGGWDNFVNQTQNPQNNIYGAYLMAENELSARIANFELMKRDELGQGKGFLSFKTCKDVPVPGDADFIGPSRSGDTTTGLSSDFIGPAGPGQTIRQKACTVQTPGSVINDSLSRSLGSSFAQLELADEFDEITNALVAQLVQKVVIGGLRAVSGSGKSDKNSYFGGEGKILERQQLIDQGKADTEALKTSISTLLDKEQKYYNSYESMFNNMNMLKERFQTIIGKCQLLENGNGIIPIGVRNTKEQSLLILNNEVSPQIPALEIELNSARAKMGTLNGLLTQAQSTTDTIELGTIAQRVQAASFVTHNDQNITSAQDKEKVILQRVTELNRTATSYEGICK